jgi:hypothetical protein
MAARLRSRLGLDLAGGVVEAGRGVEVDMVEEEEIERDCG